jgi:uncharacterized membrane protein (DUF373 family)
MADEAPEDPDKPAPEISKLGLMAGPAFLGVETLAYIVLGALLAFAAALGIINACIALFGAARDFQDLERLVEATDELLFVLMLVEILHTVRVSFRAGVLAAEPFLIVGLIASIRRVLVITLQSSRMSGPGAWTPQTQQMLNGSLMELAVLSGLILIMVVSIFILRRSGPATTA